MPIKTIIVLLAMWNVSVGLGAADDPFIGTWKLNLAKSQSIPGPLLKSTTMKIEPHGSGVMVTRDGEDSAGHWEFTANLDGKHYPVTNDPTRDTVALKRIDAYTWEGTNKKAGKANSSSVRWVVSKDGKTLTLKWKGMNAQGQPTNNVRIYDKQ